jgi:hypothetical protein
VGADAATMTCDLANNTNWPAAGFQSCIAGMVRGRPSRRIAMSAFAALGLDGTTLQPTHSPMVMMARHRIECPPLEKVFTLFPRMQDSTIRVRSPTKPTCCDVSSVREVMSKIEDGNDRMMVASSRTHHMLLLRSPSKKPEASRTTEPSLAVSAPGEGVRRTQDAAETGRTQYELTSACRR